MCVFVCVGGGGGGGEDIVDFFFLSFFHLFCQILFSHKRNKQETYYLLI